MKSINKEYLGTATYCPEDNKLRFYPDARLSKEDYERVEKAGFKWAPKQNLFVKPKWGPIAEDLMLEWCGSIDDEDMTPEDRAADRAERFAMYRDKRRAEAHEHADSFDNGPSVHGYQSEKRAERAAARHDRQRVKAYTQWGKAEYWQMRTKGVISNALYKAAPHVRRNRILRIEAEQRANRKEYEKAVFVYDAWKNVANEQDQQKAFKTAENLAGCYSGFSFDYKHPRKDQKNSLWRLLTQEDDPITPHEAAELYSSRHYDPRDPDTYTNRYNKHYTLRLAYENQMLEAEGGKVSEVEMIAGGFIGKHQIHKINKSPVTGLVVSVGLYAPHPWDKSKPWAVRSFNIQKLSREAYRAPTTEELEAFNKLKEADKAEQKAINTLKPKLLNPDKESAERLQSIWNSKAKSLYEEYQPTQVRELTQAQYSTRSKGSYSYYSTVELKEDGHIKSKHWNSNDDKLKTACKVRQCPAGASFTHQAPCVIVITDKPRHKLPEFHEITVPTPEAEKVTA